MFGKNMRKFRQYPLEPLKIDYDDEDVFVDNSHSFGSVKYSSHQVVSVTPSLTMDSGTTKDYVDSGIQAEGLLQRDVEDDAFAPLLSRQPSWGLHRKRSSKKRKDYFRFRYFFSYYITSCLEDILFCLNRI